MFEYIFLGFVAYFLISSWLIEIKFTRLFKEFDIELKRFNKHFHNLAQPKPVFGKLYAKGAHVKAIGEFLDDRLSDLPIELQDKWKKLILLKTKHKQKGCLLLFFWGIVVIKWVFVD